MGLKVGQGAKNSQAMASSGLQASSNGSRYQDDRPIRASGQYNLDRMDVTQAGEDTIMGETLNTMEMTSGPMVGTAHSDTQRQAECQFRQENSS